MQKRAAQWAAVSTDIHARVADRKPRAVGFCRAHLSVASLPCAPRSSSSGEQRRRSMQASARGCATLLYTSYSRTAVEVGVGDGGSTGLGKAAPTGCTCVAGRHAAAWAACPRPPEPAGPRCAGSALACLRHGRRVQGAIQQHAAPAGAGKRFQQVEACSQRQGRVPGRRAARRGGPASPTGTAHPALPSDAPPAGALFTRARWPPAPD